MGKSVGPLNLDDISISPKYRSSHWQKAHADSDWDSMVEIFRDRIEGRFLKPIRLIAEDRDIGEFSGFSILALDCLIIETLNLFYSGLNETEGAHDKAFWNFRPSQAQRPCLMTALSHNQRRSNWLKLLK